MTCSVCQTPNEAEKILEQQLATAQAEILRLNAELTEVYARMKKAQP